MIPIAVSLQQAETARIFIEIRIQVILCRIDQGPPNPFTGAGPHGQAVRVVNLRPPIVCPAPIVLAVEKHAGQRRNAQPVDGLARIQRRIDVHGQRAARRNEKAQGARDAGESISAYRVRTPELLAGRSNQKAVKRGNSSGRG